MVVLGVTLMLVPVMPLLQLTFPLQPVAVIVTNSPEQILLLLAATAGVVGALTMIVIRFDSSLTQVFTLHIAV